MSGHSKWSNIKHKKEKTDTQRAKIFTKTGREIAVAVREGGTDPSANAHLKDIIAKARVNNVPNDNITRMIAKAAGSGEGDAYESITYEGYGPNGIAVIVETMTDNRNRTAAEMRHYFDKYGGNLGATNCVSWQFERKGVLIVDAEGKDEDEVMLDALDAGAADVQAEADVFEIYTEPDSFSLVRDALEAKGYAFLEAELEMIPSTYVTLTGEDDLKNMAKLLELLEENDDVQDVWHSWENPTED